jgi:hypothetical protein
LPTFGIVLPTTVDVKYGDIAVSLQLSLILIHGGQGTYTVIQQGGAANSFQFTERKG